MATTDIKTLEKLVKEILEKVKSIGEQSPKENLDEAFDKINTKLETIDERLCAPNANENISAEIISKVERLDEKTQDYLKEIQTAFENCKQNQSTLINTGDSENSNIKEFVNNITSELADLKTQFENFNSEFTEISLNTGMTVSKEIISLKNHVLALNDSVENIKKEIENFNYEEDIIKASEEVFNTAFGGFKNDVYVVLGKITGALNDSLISIDNLSAELKTFEGLELSIGEIKENQQKNKTEILKVFQNNIEEENKKLLPQIMQLVNSISFDESAEEIKDGLFAVNENLGIVNKNIETGSKSTEQVLNQLEEISKNTKDTNEEVKTVVKCTNDEIKKTVKYSNDEIKLIMHDSNEEIKTIFNDTNEEIKTAVQNSNEEIKTAVQNSNEEIKNIVQDTNEEIKTIVQNTNSEIKTIVKDSNDEISTLVKQDLIDKLSQMNLFLSDVSNDFAILTKGSKGETDSYLYSLLDLESDISKVRVILDELNHTIQDDRSLAESITKNISDKIANLNSFVEQTSLLYTSPDYKEILTQLDGLNDDITSISKRTNKLILTSDDASEKLQKNIEDFQKIMVNISETVKSFENAKSFKELGVKTDNIQKMLLNSAQSDKAINEAFVYLANWIDITTDDIKNIKASLAEIKNTENEIKDTKKEIKDIKADLTAIKVSIEQQNQVEQIDTEPDTKAFEKIEKLLKETNKKLTENVNKIEQIEEKVGNNTAILSTVEFISAQVQVINENINANKTLNKKIDKMEKQIQKLLSYVEEDDE